jgi:tetrahydromethanopterin S-methyltransferase subunit B
MGGDAEMFTETSWMCSFGEDRVRIDTYEDDGQMEQARAATADFYASTDPSKTLADFPFVCGNLWTAGFDYNETRDIAIGLLIEAGINAGTC